MNTEPEYTMCTETELALTLLRAARRYRQNQSVANGCVLASAAEALIAHLDPNEGIELQWVDTNDVTADGTPRVLTFDECAMRGLDGTLRS